MIKTTRQRHNITQKRLAVEARITQGYLSKLECEEKVVHSPTITCIISLSDALGISAYDLSKWFIDKEVQQKGNKKENGNKKQFLKTTR